MRTRRRLPVASLSRHGCTLSQPCLFLPPPRQITGAHDKIRTLFFFTSIGANILKKIIVVQLSVVIVYRVRLTYKIFIRIYLLEYKIKFMDVFFIFQIASCIRILCVLSSGQLTNVRPFIN
jgi:hypothetical protein